MELMCQCSQCKGHSDKIEMLCQRILEERGIKRSLFEEYAAIFELPASLKGVWTSAARLTKDIFPILLSADEVAVRKFAHKFFKVAEAIYMSSELDSKVPQFTLQPDPSKRNQRPGFLVEHPLHGLLWFGCENEWHNSRYAGFRAHLMMGYLKIRSKHSEEKNLLINICRHGRMVGSSGERPAPKNRGGEITDGSPLELGVLNRGDQENAIGVPCATENASGFDQVSRNANQKSEDDDADVRSVILPQLLPLMPVEWIGKEAANIVRQFFDSVKNSDIPGSEKRTLVILADALEGKVSNRAGTLNRKNQGAKGGYADIIGGYGEFLCVPRSVPSDDFELIEVVKKHDNSSNHNIITAGLDQQDISEVESEGKIRPKKEIYSDRGDRLLHIGNSNFGEVVAMLNQHLPFHPRQCIPEDIHYLLTTHDAVYAGSTDVKKVEACLLAELVLLTGQGLEKCHAVRCAEKTKGQQLIIDPEFKQLMFSTWVPQGHDRSVRKPLVLQLPKRIGQVLRLLRQIRGQKLHGSIFSFDLQDLKDELVAELECIEITHGVNLKLPSIIKHLFTILTQQAGGNESFAIHLTGMPDHGGFVPATYTQFTDDELRRRYNRAIKWILGKALGDDNCFDHELLFEDGIQGSSFVPTLQDVKAALKKLINGVNVCKRLPANRANLPKAHLYYSVFVQITLQFVTGCRFVTLPLSDERLYDAKGAVGFISDKDGDIPIHDHLPYLPKMCLDLLDEYTNVHRKHVGNRLIVFNTKVGDEIINLKLPTVTRDRRKNRKAYRDNPKFMFEILPDFSRGLIQPRLVNQVLGELGAEALSDNSLRHFFRSEMIRRGVSDEAVRGSQGHSRAGEQTHGVFSGLSPHGVRQSIEKALEDLISDVGLKFIKSPLRSQR